MFCNLNHKKMAKPVLIMDGNLGDKIRKSESNPLERVYKQGFVPYYGKKHLPTIFDLIEAAKQKLNIPIEQPLQLSNFF